MNLQEALKPLHYLYKIFGLATYDITKKSTKIFSKKIYTINDRKVYIYSIQLIVYAILLILSSTYKIMYIDKINFSHIWFSQYYYLSATFLDISVSIIYMILTIKRTRAISSIYNKINKLNVISNYTEINKILKIELLLFVIILPGLIGLSIRAGSLVNAFAPIIISVGPFARDYLISTQFINLMLILHKHFSFLNEQTIHSRDFVQWCKLYHKLYNIAKLINKTFGPHMMFSVILRVCWIVSNGYDVIMLLTKNIKYLTAKLEEIYVYFPWLFIDVTTLLFIIKICTSVKVTAAIFIKILTQYRKEIHLTQVRITLKKNKNPTLKIVNTIECHVLLKVPL